MSGVPISSSCSSCPSHFVPIGASGADDQEDAVDDAAEQQRIVGRQDRRRDPTARCQTAAKAT